MEDLIAKQIKDRDPQEVEELVLDNARCVVVAGLSGKFGNLIRLSIVNAGLTSLEGFPSLPRLKELQLGDNKLNGGLKALAGCPLLNCLGLAGNKFSELEDLKPLSSLATLVSLDLYNCPVTSLQEYRSQVFQLLPSLKSLDGLNEKGDEVESEGEEEEEEGDSEGGDEDDDDEPGLDYLLNNDLRSDSEEEDYDPDEDEPTASNDEEVTDDDDDDDDGGGPSSPKRAKLSKEIVNPVDTSDTD